MKSSVRSWVSENDLISDEHKILSIEKDLNLSDDTQENISINKISKTQSGSKNNQFQNHKIYNENL